MPKPTKFARGQIREQMVAKLGTDKVTLTLSDGTDVSWQHPQLRGSKVSATLQSFLAAEDGPGFARELLGDEQWDLLVADCEDEDEATDEVILADHEEQIRTRGLFESRPTR